MSARIKRTSKSHHGSLHELNITPLLDLAFVLLVIFIITTPQLLNNLELSLPSGPPSTPQAEPRIHRLAVGRNGSVRLNGAPVPLEELRGRLSLLKQQEPEAAVVLQGAADTDYQNVVVVLDLLQQLDFTKVGLATDAEGAAGG